MFGFLIFIHEFGHYITARIFNVTIEEFSIGMGPRLITWVSKKTGIRYSISLLPIGGFVAMPGENGEYNDTNIVKDDGGEPDYNGDTADKYANDPNTFGKKPAWQRFIITAAGATVNILAGFLAMIILTSFINIGNTRVAEYYTEEDLGLSIESSAKLELGEEIPEVTLTEKDGEFYLASGLESALAYSFNFSTFIPARLVDGNPCGEYTKMKNSL